MHQKLGRMMLMLSVVGIAGVTAASADTLNGAGGTWETVTTNQLYGYPSSSNYTNYYWNNYSPDGQPNPNNQANVGWCVLGGGQCSIIHPAGNGNAQTYVNPTNLGTGAGSYSNNNVSNGTAVNNMWFTSSSATTPTTLEVSLTDQNSKNGQGQLVFGYYQLSSTGTMVGTPVPLFNSSTATQGQMASIAVPAGTGYGFYVENLQGPGTPNETDYWFYMNDSLDKSYIPATNQPGTLPGDTNQHFAIFNNLSDPGSFYVGAFGTPECSGNYTPYNAPCAYQPTFDYNSFVVSVGPLATTTSPEPGAMALVGMGLLAAALIPRRLLFRPRKS